MRDLLSDPKNYARPINWRYASDKVAEMIKALPLASARLTKLRILCLNDLLVGDSCKNIFYFHICLFFWFSNMILLDASILPVSQLQTQ